MRPKSIEVIPLGNYMLEVLFDNGEKKIFDVKPYLKFKQFKELCPDELYNNSKKYKEEIVWKKTN